MVACISQRCRQHMASKMAGIHFSGSNIAFAAFELWASACSSPCPCAFHLTVRLRARASAMFQQTIRKLINCGRLGRDWQGIVSSEAPASKLSTMRGRCGCCKLLNTSTSTRSWSLGGSSDRKGWTHNFRIFLLDGSKNSAAWTLPDMMQACLSASGCTNDPQSSSLNRPRAAWIEEFQAANPRHQLFKSQATAPATVRPCERRAGQASEAVIACVNSSQLATGATPHAVQHQNSFGL